MCTVMSCLIKRTEAEISSKVYLTIHKLIITEDKIVSNLQHSTVR